MKNLFKFMLIALVSLVVLPSCERVAPNYQGVLMEHWGKNGKSDFSLVKGRVYTMKPGTELFQVPLWEQRGEFGDRVLHLKASDNTEFTAKPMYSFRVVENRAIDVVFDNKQIGSDGSGDDFMLALMDNILEPKIYDLMKEESRRYSTELLMAEGGSLKYEDAMQKIVEQAFAEKGLQLLSFSCQLDFTDKVKDKIDARNEVNTNITVLDQQIAEQKKKNELAKLEAEYNQIQSQGLTDRVLLNKFIEKWDGSTPLYGNNPISVFVNK